MSPKKLDISQLDLFKRVDDEPGSLDIASNIRQIVTRSIKQSPQSRWHIAASMAELTGKDISKYTIDSWSCESKQSHRLPAEYVPALVRAVGDTSLIESLCRYCHGTFVPDQDLLQLELGKILEQETRLQSRKKPLKTMLKCSITTEAN